MDYMISRGYANASIDCGFLGRIASDFGAGTRGLGHSGIQLCISLQDELASEVCGRVGGATASESEPNYVGRNTSAMKDLTDPVCDGH